jgi:hypothetical protein
MDRAEVEAALSDLGDELERRRVRARLWVVGGVVMMMAFQARESTNDVDGTAYPADKVFEAARGVARQRGLPADWLNDNAKAWLPQAGYETSWMPVRTYGGLEVFFADDRMMLALKLRTSRGQRDQTDIKVLLEACHVTTESDALEIYEEFFPEDPLPRMHRDALAEIVNELTAGPRARESDPGRPRSSENDLVWVHSERGSVSHRISRSDGNEVITACGQRLNATGLRGGRSPKKRPCDRCAARRPLSMT